MRFSDFATYSVKDRIFFFVYFFVTSIANIDLTGLFMCSGFFMQLTLGTVSSDVPCPSESKMTDAIIASFSCQTYAPLLAIPSTLHLRTDGE